MSSESYVIVNDKNQPVNFVGKDAVEFFRVRSLKSAINLHKKTGIIPTRGVTITKLFAMAKTYTGKTYKRGRHDECIADLDVWLSTMESALPVVRG